MHILSFRRMVVNWLPMHHDSPTTTLLHGRGRPMDITMVSKTSTRLACRLQKCDLWENTQTFLSTSNLGAIT